MRASDTDRQRAIEELRRHCAAGRIDVDEYAARIERALGATTLEELDQLRADLPMLRIAAPAPDRKRPVWAARTAPAAPATGPETDAGAGSTPSRLGATVAIGLTVVVILAAIVIGLTAQWAWAAVLLAGWLVGLLQGRISRRPEP